MAKLKVQQKLGLAAFKVVEAQIKGPGVHVINRVAGNAVTADDVICKINSAFNLGNKIEVILNKDVELKGGLRFEKLGEVYYLVHK